MKIALVIYGKERFGGAERRLIRILNEVGKKHEVILVARRTTYAFLHESLDLSSCNVSHFSKIIAIEKNTRIGECTKTLVTLKQLNIDIIHIFDPTKFNAVLVVWMRLLGKKILMSLVNGLYFYGVNEDQKKIAFPHEINLYNFVLSKVDVLDILYPNQQQFYSEKVNKPCLVRITPGTFTDLKLFRPQKKEKWIVFVAARLNKQKNPQLMIDAVKLCKEALRSHGYKVLICGRGWEEDSIRKQIDRDNLGDIVIMPGYINPNKVLPKAEVLCALQSINNYPSQTIAEAAASGCYIIATNTGETYRMLDASFSEMIELSPTALSKAIKTYIHLQDDQKASCSAHARMYAEKHFSIDPSVEYFLDLYESCEHISIGNDHGKSAPSKTQNTSNTPDAF